MHHMPYAMCHVTCAMHPIPYTICHRPYAIDHMRNATSHKPQDTSHKPQAISHMPYTKYPRPATQHHIQVIIHHIHYTMNCCIGNKTRPWSMKTAPACASQKCHTGKRRKAMVLCEFYPKPRCPLPFPLPPELKCRLCPWAACTFAKGGGGMGRGIAPPTHPKSKKLKNPKFMKTP